MYERHADGNVLLSVPTDFFGTRNFTTPEVFWSEPSQHREAEALHRSGGHLHWQVSGWLQCSNCVYSKIRLHSALDVNWSLCHGVCIYISIW